MANAGGGAHVEADRTQPIRVAIVEDHAMVGEGIAAVIGEEADLTVVGLARTVERAERLIGRERPDVVLVDSASQMATAPR